MNKCEEILFESMEDNFTIIINELVFFRRLHFYTKLLRYYKIIQLALYAKTYAHALSNMRYAKFHKRNNYSIGKLSRE